MIVTLKNIFGGLLICTSIFDAIKYTIQASKIRRERKSGMSRRFINWAIMNDLVKLIYGCLLIDAYIVISSILALVCMCDLWFTIYLFYPYRYRGLNGFKRPNIFLYLINSIVPNRIRRRL